MTPDWIAPNRTALLVIDMQVDFGAPDGALALQGADVAAAQDALAKAQELTAAARAAQVPVIFVRLLTRPGGETHIIAEEKARRGDDGPDLCVEGTRGADFIGPQPQPGEAIVSKTRYSAFAHTGLDKQLRTQDIDTLVLVGLTTECCVASSAWDAFERDFHVFIAADACAAYEPELHEQALKALGLSGAVVASVQDFAAGWKIGK